jgi:hypothetical protein
MDAGETPLSKPTQRGEEVTPRHMMFEKDGPSNLSTKPEQECAKDAHPMREA